MGKEEEFCKKVLEEDILHFYSNDSMDKARIVNVHEHLQSLK